MSNYKMHMKKKGGAAMAGRDDYSGTGEPNVIKEAKERKSGGSVHHTKGSKGKHRIHKKRGGGVGCDNHPFSSAYTGSSEAK